MLVKRKIGELRVSELRAELEKRQLDNKGLKSALLQRLQKAIIDEGGNVDEIEIEVPSATSALQKKSSPRVKRVIENVTETDDDAVPSIKAPSKPVTAEEKLVQKNDENTREAVGTKPTSGDEDESLSPAKQSQIPIENEEDHVEEENLVDSNDSKSNRNENVSSMESVHTNIDSDSHAFSVSTKESSIVVAEEVSQHDSDMIESQSIDGSDMQPDITHVVDAAEDASVASCQDDLKEQSLADHELDNENAMDSNNDFTNDDNEIQNTRSNDIDDDQFDDNVEDNDEYDEADEVDRGNIALEEDVLDMLDYDIEMPEHGQVDQDNEGSESQNDGKMDEDLHQDKAEEGGTKDSSLASESSKEGRVSGDEKGLKNLWITGLSATTRARELKVAFSRYGKVVGAKVVTNARSPGAKCYGFVAMATPEAANKCILHLHKTELDGRMITVECTKNDPSTRKNPHEKTTGKEDRAATSRSSVLSDKNASTSHRSVGDAPNEASSEAAGKRNRLEAPSSRFRQINNSRMGKQRIRRSPDIRSRGGARVMRRPIRDSVGEPFRKRPRTVGERKVMIDNKRGGMSLRVNVRSAQDSRRPTALHRVPRSPIRTVRASREVEDRPPARRLDSRSIAQEHARIRNREMREREVRDRELRSRDAREEISRRKAAQRPNRSMALQASIERDRLQLRKEKEERNFLRQERERVERERRQLERDRLERERLEQERIKLEIERKRELEKIEREKEEMKRLKEINRYEQSQHQRALKRMYDDRSHDDRTDTKRVDRDDRRRYEGEPRDRHGGSANPFYREEEAPYRSRGGASSRIEQGRMEKMDYHDIDRRNISNNDTDARYSGGRRVEKYERPGMKSADYVSDRREEIGGSVTYRHHEKDVSDDRKVMSRDRGRATSGVYRREEPPLPKKEPFPPMRTSSRPRPADRDLREEIRQVPMVSARKGSPHRSELRHRDDSPVGRNVTRGAAESSKYPERGRPEVQMHSGTPLESGPPGGKPIPTTGRSGIPFQPSTAWPTWQHGPSSLPVGRMPVAPIGLPFNPLSTVAPPPMGADAGLMGHSLPTSFSQSRIDNNFKPVRRY